MIWRNAGQFDVEIYHHLQAGEHVRKYRTNLDGCGYIVARAAFAADAAAAADEAYRRIAKEALRPEKQRRGGPRHGSEKQYRWLSAGKRKNSTSLFGANRSSLPPI